MRSPSIIAVLAALALGALPSKASADDPPQRLAITPTPAAPSDGVYAVGDDVVFMIDHAQAQTRMRFVGSDEVFYLTSDPSTLGGRVLKYDTGETALAVTGWGGVTFYSKETPGGMPAERVGEAMPLDPKPVSSHDAKYFAAALSQRLADRDNLAVGFATRWEWLSHEDGARALATDAMRNATYAVEQLLHSRKSRNAVASRLRVIRVVAGTAKSAKMEDDTLVVTVAPQGGPSARPSSMAITEAIAGKF